MAAYILDTFPIVRRHDEAAFGHYRTKAMVLAYYNALAAGDTRHRCGRLRRDFALEAKSARMHQTLD